MKVILTCWLCVYVCLGFGQTNALTGSVVARKNNDGLNQVRITITGRNNQAVTDDNGKFYLLLPTELSKGKVVTLTISKAGYKTRIENIPISDLAVTFKLEEEKKEILVGEKKQEVPSPSREQLNAVNYFQSELKNEDMDRRLNAAKVLGEMGALAKTATTSLINTILQDKYDQVKVEVIKALARIGNRSKQVEEILRIAIKNKSYLVKVQGVRAIRDLMIRTENVVQDLIIARQDKNIQVSLEAAMTLAIFKPSNKPQVIPHALQGLTVLDNEVQDSCYSFLNSYGRLPAEAEISIINILNDDFPLMYNKEVEEVKDDYGPNGRYLWWKETKKKALKFADRYFSIYTEAFSQYVFEEKIKFSYLYPWPETSSLPSLISKIALVNPDYIKDLASKVLARPKEIKPFLHYFYSKRHESAKKLFIGLLAMIDSTARAEFDSFFVSKLDENEMRSLLYFVIDCKVYLREWQNPVSKVAFNKDYSQRSYFDKESCGEIALAMLLNDTIGTAMVLKKIHSPSAFMPCVIYQKCEFTTINKFSLVNALWTRLLVNHFGECEIVISYFLNHVLFLDPQFKTSLVKAFAFYDYETKKRIVKHLSYYASFLADSNQVKIIDELVDFVVTLMSDEVLAPAATEYILKACHVNGKYLNKLKRAKHIVKDRHLRKKIQQRLRKN